MTPKIKEILSWYGSDNPGTLTNLARLLNHDKLAGTGNLVILPVDQGFEHGSARSFAANPPAYDLRYLSKSNYQPNISNSRLPGRFTKKCRFRWRSLSGKRIAPPTERVRHVVQSAFNGRRIVIFSGGATHSDDALLEEVRAIHCGGGFGSIIGRNSFQRSKPDALKLLNSVMEIYSGS